MCDRKYTSVLVLLVLVIVTSVSFAAPKCKIYLPFEGTDGYYDTLDPAWQNRAVDYNEVPWYYERPGIYTDEPFYPSPLIAEGGGLGGSDCMDLTMATAMKGSCGTLYFGKLANTADAWFSNTPAEDAFDNALSFTICGWFNTKDPAVAISDGATARLIHKYSQVSILSVSGGRLDLFLKKPGFNKQVISAYHMYEQKNEWVFFAVTYDGSVTEVDGTDVKFYVGTEAGEIQGAGQGTTGGNYGPLSFGLGSYLVVGNYGLGSSHGNASFKGYLDNFRVYSSKSDSSGALSVDDIEAIRRGDLGEAVPAYKDGDINEDFAVDSGDLAEFSDQWLATTDTNNPLSEPVIPEPAIYIAFDGTDGAPYDVNDPAFENLGSEGTGEKPSMVVVNNAGDLKISADGIRGGALDLTDQPMNSLSTRLVYGNTDIAGVDSAIQNAMNDAQSMTVVCWWKQSDEYGIIGNGALDDAAYLLHRVGQVSLFAHQRLSFGVFGEMGFTAGDGDENSGLMVFSPIVYPDVDSWVFFAFTFDGTEPQTDPAVGRIKWYRGSIGQPVTMHTQVVYSLDTLWGPDNGSPLILGNDMIDSSASGNFSAMIDEVRIYVSKTDGSASLSAEQLESIRLRDSIEYNYKSADINKDRDVDMVDFAELADNWLKTYGPVTGMPIPQAGAYIPFENSNGTAGNGSESNPGWANIGTSGPETVSYIGSSIATAHPVIVDQVADNGIKGAYEDNTSNGTAGVDTTETLSYKYGLVTDVMSQAKSYTFTFWVNTRNASNAGSESYVFNQFGTGTPRLKWRGDGRMQALINGAWYYTGYHTGDSNGEWVFYAMTVDSSSVKFYTGTKTGEVVAAGESVGLSNPALPTLAGGSTTSLFVLNGVTYNATDKYAGYDLDEFRVYSSTTDDSGALDIDTLEDIRQYDMGM